MCINRNWKSIVTTKSNGAIFAQRSDSTIIILFEDEFKSISDFIKKLEEFRNCGCSKGKPCNKHLEETERMQNVS